MVPCFALKTMLQSLIWLLSNLEPRDSLVMHGSGKICFCQGIIGLWRPPLLLLVNDMLSKQKSFLTRYHCQTFQLQLQPASHYHDNCWALAAIQGGKEFSSGLSIILHGLRRTRCLLINVPPVPPVCHTHPFVHRQLISQCFRWKRRMQLEPSRRCSLMQPSRWHRKESWRCCKLWGGSWWYVALSKWLHSQIHYMEPIQTMMKPIPII